MKTLLRNILRHFRICNLSIYNDVNNTLAIFFVTTTAAIITNGHFIMRLAPVIRKLICEAQYAIMYLKEELKNEISIVDDDFT